MGMFELPPKGVPNTKDLGQKHAIEPHYSPNLSSLMEGEPITAVCRVIPLISPDGHTKGFILKSVIGEVGKKKEEKQEQPKETLDSFVEEDEQI